MSAPRISVVMPVYNRDWCVGEAIESVLATNEPGLELVIVDDGSTDGTSDLLAQYAARDPARIRVLGHGGRVNRGIACSRNLGVSASSGEYLAFLDSDDLYLPGRFQHAIPWLDQHPQTLGCIEPFVIENMSDPSSRRLVRHLTDVPTDQLGWLQAMLFASTYWNMPTITLRRDALPAFGRFDERLKFAEETALWLRLAAAQRIGVAQGQEPVACVRRHKQHSWNPADRVADRSTYLHVLLDVLAWAKSRTDLPPGTIDVLMDKLRRFLVEILSDPGLPLPTRLRAWQRSLSVCPGLATDHQVAANVVRAPFRRQHTEAT